MDQPPLNPRILGEAGTGQTPPQRIPEAGKVRDSRGEQLGTAGLAAISDGPGLRRRDKALAKYWMVLLGEV